MKDAVKEKEKENTDLQAKLDKITAYDELLALKETYTKNETVFKVLESEALKNALNKYSSLNQTYNK